MIHTSNGYLALVLGIFMIGNLSMLGCATNRPVSNTELSKDEVNIGYGSVAAQHVTGAVSTLDADETDPTNAITFADMLRGRVAGVEVMPGPAGGIKLQIRGANTIMGGTEPLIVLDGFPIQGTTNLLYHINPADIESITVLKDAASTAIYGMRGANGVIVIETKAGR